jgi:cytochrome c oxidase subunit IV
MNPTVPRRVTIVFACLIAATCITWWLGSETTLTGGILGVAATLTILISFAKVYFIGRDFMDLRAAPRVLRLAFGSWVSAVAVAAVALVVV